MRKLVLACAALATLGLGVPMGASAEELSVGVGGDRDTYRDRGEYRTSREFRGGPEPTTIMIDMTAVYTVVGTKIAGSEP
jgi:hypothetical protein